MIAESVLADLGIQLAGGNDREVRGFCPVHHLVKGRPQHSPKWYMNRSTGAWLCFTCGQRGSIFTLASLLGADDEVLQQVPVEIMKASVEHWAMEEAEEEKETVFVSHYAFMKNPLPPKRMRESRGLSKEACQRYNLRWSKEGHCFLTPIYDFGAQFIGWQEKAKGYSLNYPDGVQKSHSLFGYQQITGRRSMMVESPLDVVHLATEGLTAVATYGAFVSNAQLEAMVAAVDEVILAFDRDEEGMNAMVDVGRRLTNVVKVKYFKYPKEESGKDPGELSYDAIMDGLASATSFLRGASYSHALSLKETRRAKYLRGAHNPTRR